LASGMKKPSPMGYGDLTKEPDKNNHNSDISRDNDSDINSDNKSDVSSDNASDKTNDNASDNESAITSDINSDMLKPKKQPKYTDLHERRTHYLTKENIEFIEHLYSKYNQDKSETVNRALKLYKEMLKNNKKK
jgi:hypothetical protein